jgi:hypothetical protein
MQALVAVNKAAVAREARESRESREASESRDQKAGNLAEVAGEPPAGMLQRMTFGIYFYAEPAEPAETATAAALEPQSNPSKKADRDAKP